MCGARLPRAELFGRTAQSVGVFLCRAAIEQGQPYGPWPEDMVKTLGDEEQMTFTFYYR